MDNDAERDDNGSLQRSTLPTGKKSITFSTHILHLNEKINMQNIINSGIVNTWQNLDLHWHFVADDCLRVDAYRKSEGKDELVFSSRVLFD